MRACPTYENRPLPTSVASANSVVLIKRLVRNDGNTLKKFEPSRLAFQGNPGSLEPTPIDGARKMQRFILRSWTIDTTVPPKFIHLRLFTVPANITIYMTCLRGRNLKTRLTTRYSLMPVAF